jgi:flagellar motor switch protein FliG
MLQLMREAVERRPAAPESRAAVAAMLDKVERGELALVRALPALDQEARHEVFQALAGRSPRMTESVPVPERGFGFEDIAQMTDREIQTLLREVDQKDLVVALKGASPGLREKVLANTSARVRRFLQEEMYFLGPVPPAAMLGVQTRVAAQVLRLWAQGQVDLPGRA